ncbi:MAG: hypothetical protein AAGF48_14195 [Pseudomonadota bacterium]
MNERPRIRRSAAAAADTDWKSLTTEANAAFEANDFLSAEDLYEQALQEARRRFRTDRAPQTMSDAPPMLVAASANAAECHAQMGDLVRAAHVSFEALDALRSAMLDPSEHPMFRQACFEHLKSALMDYSDRVTATEVGTRVFEELVVRTREAALTYLSRKQMQH